MIYYVDHSRTLYDVLGRSGLGLKEVDDDPDEFVGDSGDLVFVHTEFSAEWISYAERNPEVEVVFISRKAPYALPSKQDLPGNGHLCQLPANSLGTDERFRDFLESYEKGSKQWNLLLMAGYPEYLLAAYILGVAKGQGVDLNKNALPEELWENAQREYGDLGGLDSNGITLDNVETKLTDIKNILAEVG